MNFLNTLGSDVEVFAVDKQNKFISLCDKIGGTKEEPKHIEGFPHGYALQEDNVSVEYNIPPAYCLDDWIMSHKVVTKHIGVVLAKEKLSISKEASASFNDSELVHPNALVFGCEPDYNAWTKTENAKPYCENKNLRTAGGHIHVGSDINMLEGIKQMDLHLGIPSILLDDSKASTERRKLYGKAGAMRPKPYGFEYRVLSNFWIFDDILLKWAYVQSRNAITNGKKISAKQAKLIQHAINTGDKDAAQTIITSYGLTLPILD